MKAGESLEVRCIIVYTDDDANDDYSICRDANDDDDDDDDDVDDDGGYGCNDNYDGNGYTNFCW